jgi:hypothetical protein
VAAARYGGRIGSKIRVICACGWRWQKTALAVDNMARFGGQKSPSGGQNVDG